MKRHRLCKSTLFAPEAGVVLNKLQASREACYSITRPAAAKAILAIIEQNLANIGLNIHECTITDATACVGGDTLHFARVFRHVNAVEINPEHHKMLINNLNVYKRLNVVPYLSDYVKVMTTMKQDVVFIDPPWGGPLYKKKKSVWLSLSGVPIQDIVYQHIKIHTPLIVLKVPTNFDISTLVYKITKIKTSDSYVRSIHIYHLNKMNIAVIATQSIKLIKSNKSPKHTRKQAA